MTLKSIYLALTGETDSNAAANAAFVLAKVFEARLIASDTVAEPGPFLDQTGIGMMATYYDELYKTAEKVLSHKRSAASDIFEKTRQDHDVPLKASADSGPSCYWHSHDGDPGVIARLGRLADIIVVACPGTRASFADLKTLEQAVFDARRPVLMVPDEAEIDVSKPAVVAWNGSAEAARALINAVPMLAQAGSASLVQVGDLDPGGTDIAEAAAYLSLYGIKPDTATVKKDGTSVSDILAEHAQKSGAGYLVMGAYTHNPWRELVLGGVTQTMIKGATLPVLLAH